MTTEKQKLPFKDRIIPWYFVLFFIVLAIVNVIFVSLATQSHPGVVIDNAYENGLNYNEIIKKTEAQSALGWQASLDIKDNKITLMVTDKFNNPLSNAKIKGMASSVLNKQQEIPISLSEIGKGHYTTRLNLPHKGQWDIAFSIIKDSDVMQVKKRILFKEDL